ncbi:PTS transporter subunit EIIC [Dielma fastidiosa]|uniref:PTS transporter subunit EIIC n=1 Tax=Dielma fastidiosa TaxID=1034346 RepID=A0AB35UQY0_9FIRM|nr:PTS transporter subunit EIIC [Dielma fastidiosa]MDY5167574.1 PTS transporter subunit EIIC [Dielma fastidiosa]
MNLNISDGREVYFERNGKKGIYQLSYIDKNKNSMNRINDNYQNLCENILTNIGGKDNILSVTHCATRLRFTLKDIGLVKQETIKKLKGVIGTQVSAGQFQIIIGQHVPDVYDVFITLAGISKAEPINENLDANLNKLSFKNILNRIFETISSCVIPIFPIFIGAGLIKMLVAILGPGLLNVFSDTSDVMVLLTFVGDAGFYYFPIFAAWSAAKRFDVSIPIALFLAAILVHPTLVGIVANGEPFTVYGIPMTLVNYSSQFIPVILMVWVLSYVQRFVDRICPVVIKVAFLPLLCVLIMLPITLCVLGPIGTYCGILIENIANLLASTVEPLAVGLIGGAWYFLVALGMDKALVPVILNSFASQGYDNLFWLSAVVATYALIGVAFAYFIRCKKEDRAMAGSNAITIALGGVSEPTIYGCIFRFKRAMIYLFTGGCVGGILASLLHVKAYTLGAGNILFFTIFAGGDGKSLIPGIICCIVAFAISFGLGLVFGFPTNKSAE